MVFTSEVCSIFTAMSSRTLLYDHVFLINMSVNAIVTQQPGNGHCEDNKRIGLSLARR